MNKQDLINNVKRNAPQEMVAASNWLGMKNVYQDGKWRKPPTTTSGYMCNANDVSLHRNFDAIAQSILNGKNEGFTYFLKPQNIVVLSFKNFTDSDDCWRTEASYIDCLLDSYTEFDEKTDDMKIFFKTESPKSGRRFNGNKDLLITNWCEVTGNIKQYQTVWEKRAIENGETVFVPETKPLRTISEALYEHLLWYLDVYCLYEEYVYTFVCPNCGHTEVLESYTQTLGICYNCQGSYGTWETCAAHGKDESPNFNLKQR